MNSIPIQNFYPDELSHCYGCGNRNDHGLHIQSYWSGDESVAEYLPKPYHTAIPGYVYGGLTASLIDCHATGTAAAAAYRNAGREMGTDPPFRFVTASLQIDFLKPTPMGVPLTVRGKVLEIGSKKVVVEVTVSVNETICSRGKVVAVQLPDTMLKK